MRTEYSIKNSITTFINIILSIIFLFISQTFLIKILGIEYTGLNGLFSNILTVLNLFELGIGNAIIYKLYKYIKDNDYEQIKAILLFYKRAYVYISITIFGIGLLLIPFLKFIIQDVTVDINVTVVYILFLFTTLTTYLLTYKRSLLIAYQKNYIINIIDILFIVILNMIQLLIIYYTKNYYLFLIVKIICTIVENIVINIRVNKEYSFILDKKVKSLNSKDKDEIITKIKALFIHKLSSVVTNGTDNVIISAFLGIKVVGLCTNYYYIINTIKKLFSSIITSTNASIGNLLVDNNYDKNYQIFKRILFLNFWIAVVTSICLYFLIEPFIRIWIGSDYLISNSVLIALIINYFQTMMRSTFIVFKDASGIWVEDKYVPLMQLTINLVSSIILVKLIGLPGVFLGTIISSLVLWFYSYPIFVYKKLFNKGIRSYFKGFIKFIIIFIFIVFISNIIINLIDINNVIIELLIKLVICLIIPNILLLIVFYKNKNLNYYWNLIRKE